MQGSVCLLPVQPEGCTEKKRNVCKVLTKKGISLDMRTEALYNVQNIGQMLLHMRKNPHMLGAAQPFYYPADAFDAAEK